MKGKEADINKKYAGKRKELKVEPDVGLADLLCAREDLAIIEKTSSATVRKNTQTAINKVIIGQVICFIFLIELILMKTYRYQIGEVVHLSKHLLHLKCHLGNRGQLVLQVAEAVALQMPEEVVSQVAEEVAKEEVVMEPAIVEVIKIITTKETLIAINPTQLLTVLEVTMQIIIGLVAVIMYNLLTLVIMIITILILRITIRIMTII